VFHYVLRSALRHQMLIFSCNVTLTSVTVTTTCVASILSDCAFKPASDTKLESHSASSPSASGGISAGGAAGSNVCMARVDRAASRS